MSESTAALQAKVQGAGELLTETATSAELLCGQATELADEAAEHGWHGMATRMREVTAALEGAAAQVTTAGEACATAGDELGSIDDTVRADQVAAHLSAGTAWLEDARSALQGAAEKADDAHAAATEIGQEGMVQATLDLHDRLISLQEEIGEYRSSTEEEQAAADGYGRRPLGN